MSYRNYPPEKNLLEVLKIAPQCAYIYIFIWKYKSSTNSFTLNKAEIWSLFHTTPTRFRNNLIILCDLSLVKYEEHDFSLQIWVKK